MNIREKFDNIKNRVMSLFNENQKLLLITMGVSLAVMIVIIYVLPQFVPKTMYGDMGDLFGKKIKSNADLSAAFSELVTMVMKILYATAFGLPVIICIGQVFNYHTEKDHHGNIVRVHNGYMPLKEIVNFYYYGWLLGASAVGFCMVLAVVNISHGGIGIVPFSGKTNLSYTLNAVIIIGGLVALFVLPYIILIYVQANYLIKKLKAFSLGILVAYIFVNFTEITESIFKWAMAPTK